MVNKQTALAIARQMGALNLPEDTAIGTILMLDTEEQAQMMLEYLKTAKPNKAEVMDKLEEILEI